MKKRHLVVGSLLLMSMLSGCKDNRIQVGILQPVDHKALTATRLGFMEGLNEKDFEFTLNSNLTSGTYRLVFKLYDNDQLIDDDIKYVIVKKKVSNWFEFTC